MYICFAWFYLEKQWKNVQESKESTYLKGAAVSGRNEVGGNGGGWGLRAKTLMDLFLEFKKKKF